VSILSKGLFRATEDARGVSAGDAAVGSGAAQVSDIEWRRPVQASFRADPTKQDTFFLTLEDFEEDEALINGLRDRLIERFEQQGLTYVDKPEEAKYACYVYVRYFNGVPEANCDQLESKAGEVFGGRAGWRIAGGETQPPLQYQEIKPMGTGGGWALLIDFAVGESTGEIGKDVDRRTGRLLACIPRADREQALWQFRMGHLPPRSEKCPKDRPLRPPHGPIPRTI
jgi:hypothetical protein